MRCRVAVAAARNPRFTGRPRPLGFKGREPLAGCDAAGEGIAFASAFRNTGLLQAVVPGRGGERGLIMGEFITGETGEVLHQ
jgi:hypothetical protein